MCVGQIYNLKKKKNKSVYLPYIDGCVDILSVWLYSCHLDPSHSHVQDTSNTSDMHLKVVMTKINVNIKYSSFSNVDKTDPS